MLSQAVLEVLDLVQLQVLGLLFLLFLFDNIHVKLSVHQLVLRVLLIVVLKLNRRVFSVDRDDCSLVFWVRPLN